MYLLVLRQYEGIDANWRGNRAAFERPTTENRLQRFELAVFWKYSLAFVRTVPTELEQNHQIPVWPVTIVSFLRGRRKVLPSSDERAVNFWLPLLDQEILHLNQAANGRTKRHVRETTTPTNATIEWVHIADLAVPPAMSEVDKTPSQAPEAPPAVPPVPVSVPEAPPAPIVAVSATPLVPAVPAIVPKVLYVRPEALQSRPATVPPVAGASVTLKSNGLRSVPAQLSARGKTPGIFSIPMFALLRRWWVRGFVSAICKGFGHFVILQRHLKTH